MEHLAILSRRRKLLPKIVSGEKTIESRWYRFRRPPFGCIAAGDTVYFKDSGEPVSVKTRVSKVLTFKDLSQGQISEIIKKYGSAIGIGPEFADEVRGKRYCVLVFLKSVQAVEPFEIDKKGFGIMNAWITVTDINQVRK